LFTERDIVGGWLNQKFDNKAYITFYSQDEAYVSAYMPTATYPVLNLFKSLKRKQQWQNAGVLDSLSSDCFTAQATVSPDGNFIVFVTNRPNSDGDTDLWIAFKQANDTWGNAMPLEELNSSGNEITPFLASSDTLYFASDGLAGQGGYDLFMSLRYDAKWSVPRPVSGLNTEFNESDFTIIPSGFAVFSSDRPGTLGGLDLFLAGQSIENKEQLTTIVEYRISALVSDIEVFSKEDFAICAATNKFPLDYFSDEIKNIPQKQYLDASYKEILTEIRVTGAELTIKCNRDTDVKKLIKKIESDLKSSIKVNITDAVDDNITLSLDSYQPATLVEIGQKKITADPPVLELFLNARPESDVAKWKVMTEINGTIDTIYNDNKQTTKLSYRISNQLEEIWNADSIVVSLQGEDKSGLLGYSTYSFLINKKQLRNRASVDFMGRMHEEYFLNLDNPEGTANDAVIEKLKENSFLSGNLVIIFPSGRDVEAAKLKANLIKKYGFTKRDITLQEGENRLGLNYLARLLAEKR
jgi:hypothetical protein